MMQTLRAKVVSAQNDQGFTLVELLMVMVIIGLLAGIGFEGWGMLKKRELATQADSFWNTINSAAEMYKVDNGTALSLANGQYIQDTLSKYLDNTESPWSADAAAENVYGQTGTAVINACNDESNIEKYITTNSPKKDQPYYCIQDGQVYVWATDGSNVGAASNNP